MHLVSSFQPFAGSTVFTETGIDGGYLEGPHTILCCAVDEFLDCCLRRGLVAHARVSIAQLAQSYRAGWKL
jgi:hypothetical protein